MMLTFLLNSVGKQIVNVPSYMVRLDSQKHIDFALTSPTVVAALAVSSARRPLPLLVVTVRRLRRTRSKCLNKKIGSTDGSRLGNQKS